MRGLFHVEQRRMDYHVHTAHSYDGEQTIGEMCERMISLGVQEICLTEHYEPGHPDPECCVQPIWDVWLDEIRQMRQRFPQLTIRTGVEIGDNPACREEAMRMVDGLAVDYRLLSLHLVNGVDCYERDIYYAGKTRAMAYREYAEAKAESILAWHNFDSVAHIGYVSRYSPWTGAEKPLQYEDAPDAFDAIFKHIISLDKCLEINTSSFALLGGTMPSESIIRRYIELGGEVFTFGSDAHRTSEDYRDIERAKELVRSLGGKYQASFANRRRTCWKI